MDRTTLQRALLIAAGIAYLLLGAAFALPTARWKDGTWDPGASLIGALLLVSGGIALFVRAKVEIRMIIAVVILIVLAYVAWIAQGPP